MSDGTYEATMSQAVMLAELLVMNCDDLGKVLRTVGHAHAFGHIADPTAYRRGMQNLEDAEALVGPLHTAACALAPVVEKIRARAGQQAVPR